MSLSDETLRAADENSGPYNPDAEIEFVHAIYKRQERDPYKPT